LITELRKLLSTGADELEVSLAGGQVDACLGYLAELKKWNRKINLTAIRDDREIVIKHFLDSFSYLKGFEAGPGLSLVDIGSGAGFPGLPLKIARPDLSVTLVESVKKKASFLRHIVRTLRLEGVEVMDRRTDELPGEALAGFDIATARAFADMGSALREGSRLLKRGGTLVLSRGPDEKLTEEEIGQAGMALIARKSLELPFSRDPRALWVFRKR
jgi:16S rRNA (guanine527-N7)-methyltransferase